MRKLARIPWVLWASPWSMLGMCVGLAALATGGRLRVRSPVVEFYGGLTARLFEHLPARPMAMTLGHVILGRTAAGLDISHSHELIHVRQYERWGPLFVLAYLLCSLGLWLRGKDAYHENPFERQAYENDNPLH